MDVTPPPALPNATPKARSVDFSGRRALVEMAIGAAWLVGIAAAVRIVDAVLGKNLLAVAVAGAVVVEFAARRAGVIWDDQPDAPDRSSPKKTGSPQRSEAGAGESYAVFVARRVGIGAAIGALIVLATVGFGLVLGLCQASMGVPSPVLGFAALHAAALSVRDELLYRGVVLAAAERARIPRPLAAAYAGLAGAAAIALLPESSPPSVVLAFASGWLFAVLWQRGRGAWVAVAAHATWMFVAGSLLRGGLVDITWTNGSLSLNPRAEGVPAYFAAAICVGVALTAGRLQGVLAGRRHGAPR